MLLWKALPRLMDVAFSHNYYALNTNVTYTNGLYAQCGADNPGLCTGGISNAEINAPGSEVKKGAAYSVFSSIVLLIQCLVFTLTI